MKTEVEQSLDCMVRIFHEFCVLYKTDDYLQFPEFKKLMKEQACPFLKDTIPAGLSEDQYLKQLFDQADKVRDHKLKFTEWCFILAKIAIDFHNKSHKFDHDHDHSHDHGHDHGHSHDHGHGHGHDQGHGH